MVKPKIGRLVTYKPTGFPAFYLKRRPRVVTADVWEFLRHLCIQKLDSRKKKIALAYIDQALEFFDAASNPKLGSKPLLYYYSFLNLVKVALLIKKVNIPTAVKHGITDPQINVRKRLRIEGQKVKLLNTAHDHSQLFPEFVKVLGGDASKHRDVKVFDILSQIPSIHRTFSQVSKRRSLFVPIKRIELLYKSGETWANIIFDKNDRDVKESLDVVKKRREFKHYLTAVSGDEGQICYEMKPVRGHRRGVDKAIRILSEQLKEIGIWYILTSSGYRYYFCAIEPRHKLPPLASTYAAFFYLGSITRYKPYDFDRILSGGYAWVVQELLATQPMQFIYSLASELAGVDVVRPYAAVH